MSLYDLKGRNLMTTCDWTDEELEYVFKLAENLKEKHYSGESYKPLEDKSFAMMFFNNSTRTRHSFETGVTQLGGHAQFVRPDTMRLTIDPVPTGKGESIEDTANVLSRFVDGLGIRLIAQSVDEFGMANKIISEFAEHADVPVINMMSELWHPCQALTDMFTLREKAASSDLSDKKMVVHWAYSPHARDWASAQETVAMGARSGMDVVVAQPDEYDLVPEAMEKAEKYAEKSGGSLVETNDLDQALEGADFVYPRNWVTLDYFDNGKKKEKEIAKNYKDWRFTKERWKERTDGKAKLMHCMPIDPNNEADVELTNDEDVSILYDQAENRLHVQKAILTATMAGKF